MITAAIIIVLLLMLGVSIGTIMLGILWLIEGILAMMTLFFLFSAVLFIMGKPVTGTFSHVEEQQKFAKAVYLIHGEPCRTLYPAESLLRKRIYRAGTHRLRMGKLHGHAILFDRHSAVIMWLGLAASAAGSVGMGLLLYYFYR